ncbi:MAG: PIN domain-containing protein [Cyanobacterium sp. T60_A2020_053]|nr:PIN domain-containing protein [Cyanobacterium sp. T60_A2020_053]
MKTAVKKSKFTQVQVIETVRWMINSLNVIPLTPEISLTALDLHYRYQFSFYDSLIISVAISSECEYLLTEDLQEGQIITYRSHLVKVINPFQ